MRSTSPWMYSARASAAPPPPPLSVPVPCPQIDPPTAPSSTACAGTAPGWAPFSSEEYYYLSLAPTLPQHPLPPVLARPPPEAPGRKAEDLLRASMQCALDGCEQVDRRCGRVMQHVLGAGSFVFGREPQNGATGGGHRTRPSTRRRVVRVRGPVHLCRRSLFAYSTHRPRSAGT